jgi:hypothetical protein
MKTAFAVNGFTDLRPVLALSPVVTLCRRRRSRRVAVGRTGSKSSALRGEGRGKQWFVRGATMLKIKETTCSLKSLMGALQRQYDILLKTHQDLKV